MLIQLQIRYNRGQTWPELDVNGCLEIKELWEKEHSKQILISCNPVDNTARISRRNKTDSETVVDDGKIIRDQTVTLEKIWVDEILIDLDIVLDTAVFINQLPQGYLDYCKVHGLESSPVESHWHTWYFNGVWTWPLAQPFWPWYAQEKKIKQTKNISQKDIDLYIGTSGDENQELLQELKDLLSAHV